MDDRIIDCFCLILHFFKFFLLSAIQFSSVQLLSQVWLFSTPWTAACQASLSITISQACSNSCPSSQWCHLTILSSVVPFSCLQSFPVSGSFQMSQFFASGGQSFGVLASTSVLPMNMQDWFPLGWTGWISLQSKGLSRVSSNTTVQASVLWYSAFFMVQLSHPYLITGKTIALTRRTFVGKVMSLLFNMLSRLVIAFLPWSKHLLISWLQSPSAVILELPKIKSTFEIMNWKVFFLYSGYMSFIRYTKCGYFLPFYRLSFYFLDGVILTTNILNFEESNISNIFICCLWFQLHCLEIIALPKVMKIYSYVFF